MNNLPAEKENSLDSEVSRPDQDEYLNPDDQLIYCSKCHTPKQMWIEPNILFSESRKVPVRCACRKKEHELAQQAKEQQERDDLIRRLYQTSCFPAGLRECTFDLAEPYHQDTLIYAKDYAEKLIEDPAFSKGILFYGVYSVPKRNADRPAGGNYAAAGGNVNRRKREFLVRRQAVDLN